MSERPQLPPGLSLVYLSGGRVAHLGEPEMRDTECRAVAKAGFRNLKADRGKWVAFYCAVIEKDGLHWEALLSQRYREGSNDGKELGYSAALNAAEAISIEACNHTEELCWCVIDSINAIRALKEKS